VELEATREKFKALAERCVLPGKILRNPKPSIQSKREFSRLLLKGVPKPEKVRDCNRQAAAGQER